MGTCWVGWKIVSKNCTKAGWAQGQLRRLRIWQSEMSQDQEHREGPCMLVREDNLEAPLPQQEPRASFPSACVGTHLARPHPKLYGPLFLILPLDPVPPAPPRGLL